MPRFPWEVARIRHAPATTSFGRRSLFKNKDIISELVVTRGRGLWNQKAMALHQIKKWLPKQNRISNKKLR